LLIVNVSGGGGSSGTTDGEGDLVAARSFVVRALLEHGADTSPGWHGFVTDVETGDRQAWRRANEVARFIEQCLAAVFEGRTGGGRTTLLGAPVAGPALTDVVTDMLAILAARLPAPVPALPDPNVTLERISEKLVGLGNHRGNEPTGALGVRTLRGGRLGGRVRFQLWGGTALAVDNAVLALHSDLLDDGEELRQAGFLRLSAVDTTLAEHVDSVSGWRKATSFEVLYEYRYVDSDDADSLIARIQVTTDPERDGSPDREQEIVVDEMVRWDDEVAPALVVRGPASVSRITALVFVPGPAIGGTVTVSRTEHGSPGPVTDLPNLAAFLTATGGDPPAHTNADVELAPADLFADLGATGDALELGDWNTDGSIDQYTGFDRRLDQAIALPTQLDRLSITYTPPPGPSTGLDQTAVVYLRVNAP
jgi:hypothetical protein